ncbi:MAG: M23 family metallopeptidase [Chloroflexi bacterium]|nr:M23 family metallopeptidase [Chloroflexota bacterium]
MRLAAILVLALIGSFVGVPSARAEAPSNLAQGIAEGRRAQAGLENAMLAGDASAAGLRGELAQARRDLRKIGIRLRRVISEQRDMRRRVGIMEGRMVDLRRQVEREARRAERAAREAEGGAEEPGAPGEETQPSGRPQVTPEPPPSRAERALGQLSQDLRWLEGRLGRVTRAERLLVRQKRGQLARLRRISGAIGAAESGAAGAAAGLSEQIRRVTVLAGRRAAERAGRMPAGTHLGFIWPTGLRITQPYGCTGFSLEPARGSCPHFHDGIDLSPGYGVEVGAAADGVVAYVGWSPMGAGDRSFMVVVAHWDGHVTLYGHLLPTEHVWVGQWVGQGEKIGLVGNTGRSTGSHLHWEVTRGGRTVDPESVIRSSRTPDPVMDPAASASSGADGLSERMTVDAAPATADEPGTANDGTDMDSLRLGYVCPARPEVAFHACWQSIGDGPAMTPSPTGRRHPRAGPGVVSGTTSRSQSEPGRPGSHRAAAGGRRGLAGGRPGDTAR